MPSTTSSVVSRPLASSTVITPSLPTFSIASLMIFPMVASPLAEMVPTWAISFGSLVALESFFSSATTASTALSMPRLISIGLLPAATSFAPSRKMAWASTVAVVVPSPATSEVLDATSFTICAPMFSNLFSSSISLATVTPSLVMVGAPHDFSMMTLRPLGPSVTLTASASVLTPWRIASRARTSNRISLAAIWSTSYSDLKSKVESRKLLFDDAEDVFLAHHQDLLAFHLDLGAGVLREEDAVADLDVERADLAVLEDLAVADGEHLTLDRLLLRRVGDDDSALGLLLLGHTLDDDAILQRSDPHGLFLPGVVWTTAGTRPVGVLVVERNQKRASVNGVPTEKSVCHGECEVPHGTSGEPAMMRKCAPSGPCSPCCRLYYSLRDPLCEPVGS